jgi:hypothetical protein
MTTLRLRVDGLSVRIVRSGPRGTLALTESRPVTAAHPVSLPVFDGWQAGSELVVTLGGVANEAFEAALELGGVARGSAVKVAVEATTTPGSFRAELRAPVASLRNLLGERLSLGVLVSSPSAPAAPPLRLPLLDLTLVPLAEPGPSIDAMELTDATDAELVGASERRSFDLANAEEGFWRRTGKALLRLSIGWSGEVGPASTLDLRPRRIFHAFLKPTQGADAALVVDASRMKVHGSVSQAELVFDTGHADLGEIPEEGKTIPLGLEGTHALAFREGGREHGIELAWALPLGVRVRDPLPQRKTFQRLGAVGIDFGTSATVAAMLSHGYRSLLQLGRPPEGGARGDEALRAAENPTVLLVDDHERLWTAMASGARFPYLVRALSGSHAAVAHMAEAPSAVIGQLKTLPERVLLMDESPQLRDREKQRDFLLDEARVRALLRAYAYLLGRAINRPGQDVYLHYVITHPSKTEAKLRALIDEELRAGLLLSIPEDIPAEDLRVDVVASEAEAFAAEVCPELCAHPDLAPLLERHGELRFVVFDLGGGTLDIACGRFRPATEEEQERLGSRAVIETLQVNGVNDLGGDLLTHELAWVVHQHPSVLPEMEAADVPMMRPPTVPKNHLAKKPELYKRGLAARQNWLRLESELLLERVKFGPEERPRSAPGLTLARLDGSDARIESLGGDLGALTEELRAHLRSRIREGVKLLASTVASAAWPGAPAEAGGAGGSLEDRGIVVLLAGNSSRSAFVAEAVTLELGLPGGGLPWTPEGKRPLAGLVLYETSPRVERGVTIVGVTPKTAVALGALKLANHEVHLVRASQGFGFFLGDLRGFPPKFTALIPMGAPSGDPASPGPHLFDFGRWDSKMPLRASRELEPGKMTSNDPRVFLVPTGLPPGHVGKLKVAVIAPDEIAVWLDTGDASHPPLVSRIKLSQALR